MKFAPVHIDCDFIRGEELCRLLTRKSYAAHFRGAKGDNGSHILSQRAGNSNAGR